MHQERELQYKVINPSSTQPDPILLCNIDVFMRLDAEKRKNAFLLLDKSQDDAAFSNVCKIVYEGASPGQWPLLLSAVKYLTSRQSDVLTSPNVYVAMDLPPPNLEKSYDKNNFVYSGKRIVDRLVHDSRRKVFCQKLGLRLANHSTRTLSLSMVLTWSAFRYIFVKNLSGLQQIVKKYSRPDFHWMRWYHNVRDASDTALEQMVEAGKLSCPYDGIGDVMVNASLDVSLTTCILDMLEAGGFPYSVRSIERGESSLMGMPIRLPYTKRIAVEQLISKTKIVEIVDRGRYLGLAHAQKSGTATLIVGLDSWLAKIGTGVNAIPVVTRHCSIIGSALALLRVFVKRNSVFSCGSSTYEKLRSMGIRTTLLTASYPPDMILCRQPSLSVGLKQYSSGEVHNQLHKIGIGGEKMSPFWTEKIGLKLVQLLEYDKKFTSWLVFCMTIQVQRDLPFIVVSRDNECVSHFSMFDSYDFDVCIDGECRECVIALSGAKVLLRHVRDPALSGNSHSLFRCIDIPFLIEVLSENKKLSVVRQ